MNDTDTKELLETLNSLLKQTPGLPWEYYEIPGCTDGIGYIRPEDYEGKEIHHAGDMGWSDEQNKAIGKITVEAVNKLPFLLSLASRTEAAEREKTLTRALAEAVTDKELLENLKRELAETSKQCEQYRLETHRWADAVKKDRIERDKQFSTISTQAAENATLRSLLKELYATVKGECPSLFNEESGNARLDAEIEAALTKPQPEGQSTEFTDKEISGYFEKAKQPNAKVDEILANTPETFTELLKQQPEE